MAYSHIPTFVAKGAFQSGIAALTVPVPTGYRNNDVLLLFVESANQAIAAPTGWTEVTSSPQSTGTAAAIGGVRLGVFYKIAAGTEASVTVADTGDHTTAIMMAFRGVDPTDPIDITAGRVDSTATTAMSWAAVTTTVPNTLIVLATALDQDIAGTAQVGTVTNANLSSITEQHDQTIASGVGGGLHVATGIKATAGSTGTSTATGAASTTHAYLTIALQGRSDAIVVPRGQYQADLETVVPISGAYTGGATDGIYLAADISPVWEQDTTYQAKAEIETTATSFDDTATITNGSFEPEATDTNYTPRGGSLVYDSKNDRYIFFGGYDGTTRYNNVWAKEMATPGRPWRKLNPTGTPPTAKNLAAASYFRGNKTTGGADTAIMIVWGGAGGSDLNEMHILNVTTPGSEVWTTVTQTSAPSVRSYIQRHSVAVPVSGDTSQCHFYLFGGWAASRENALFRCTVDLDSLSSVTWTTLKANGAVGNPTIRSGAILDYKASTSKLYLYGGYSGTAYLTDFWEYDIAGNTWTNTSPTGTAPTGTEFPVGGYDAVNNRFWYSGGYQGSGATAKNNVGYISDVGGSEAYNEVRAHDSDNMQYTGHGSAANCIDTTRNWLVLHGMQTVDSTERYSFIIDLNDGITSSKPVYGLSEGEFLNARDAMASVYNPDRNEWLIIGGFGNMSDDTTIATGQHLNDIWAYDYTNNQWRWANKGHKAMPQSEGSTAVYDTARDRVVIFGGLSGISETGNEVWTATADENGLYELERLTPTGTPPTSRWLVHGAYDATNDRCVFALGGNDVGPFNEVWELSFSSSAQGVWTQRTPTGSVTPIMGGGYVNKTSNNRLYIFGGATNAGLSTVSSQLVYLDYTTTNCVWTVVTPPNATARRTPALVYDATNDKLITFGGFNGSTQLEALAYYDIAAGGGWVNVTPSSTLKPDARRSHGHAFINGEMYITHGRALSGSTWYRNTWKHTPNYTTPSSSTWTNKNPRAFQQQYFFFDPNTSGDYHWQAWTTEESTDHTKVGFNMATSSYYFDAHTSLSDPNNEWTNDANGFDSSTSTSTTVLGTANGSSSIRYLSGVGTTAPTSGGTISQVRARMNAGGTGNSVAGVVRYSGVDLGVIPVGAGVSNSWGVYVVLTAPSGGWTWAKVAELEARMWATDILDGGGGFFKVEIEVTHDSDPDFTLGTSGPATITISHTTNAIKRLNTIRTHTTSSIKRKEFTLAHATSSYLRKQATTSHTTDADKRKATTKTHTTDSYKRKSYTLSHSTDTNKKVSGFTRTHTTDAYRSVPLQRLYDNFDDNTIDTVKWNAWNGALEQNGHLEMPSETFVMYKGFTSQSTYNLTSSRIFAEIVDAGDQSIVSWEVYPVQLLKADSITQNAIWWYISAGTIRAYKKVSGSQSFLYSATYDNTTYRWLRIRESSGTVYWDSSTDGINWTNRASELVSALWDVTDIKVEPSSGQWQPEATTTTAILDNINVATPRLTHSTDAFKKRSGILSHTTDSLKRKASTVSHTTNALKRKAITVLHTTDALKRKQVILTHLTDALKRKQSTKSHTTDSFKRTQTTKTHTTDSLKRKQFTKTYTTDTLKRKQSVLSHTSNSLKRKQNTVAHSTDALKRKQSILVHTTDAFKRKAATLSHTTDAFPRRFTAVTLTHLTNALLRKVFTLSHTTDANKKKATTLAHTTSTNKKKSGVTVAHTTDGLLRKQVTKTHTTSANKRVTGVTRSHTTDALKRKLLTLIHTTNAYTRALVQFRAHTTDSFLHKQIAKVHTTDANKKKASSATHTTSANKRKLFTLTHVTDALKRSARTATHTTSSFKRKAVTLVHTTSALVRKTTLKSHTTSSYIRSGFSGAHNTDANKRVSGNQHSHTVDSLLRERFPRDKMVNGGFEQGSGTTNANFNVLGWEPTNPLNATVVSIDTTQPYSGTQALKIAVDATNSNNGVKTNVPIKVAPNSRYQLRFKAKSSTAGQLQIQLRNGYLTGIFLQADGVTWDSNPAYFTINTTTTYAQYNVVDFTTSSNGLFYISDLKRTGVGPSQANRTFYIDEVELVPITWHTTDAIKRKANTSTHTTSAFKRRALTVTHTTSTNKRKATTQAHTTDSLLRSANNITHSTDILKRKGGIVVSHLTDAFLHKTIELSHATDSMLRKAISLSHSVDSLLRKLNAVFHSTSSTRGGVTRIQHSTDAHLRDLRHRKKVLIDGQWQQKPVKVLVGGQWITKPVMYWNGTSWIETSQ